MSMEKILVVDDDEDIQNILKIYIENEGYCYYSAYCFEQAVEILEKMPIDLIILDVMLPGKDGFETCLEIRKKARTPIIFLSCKGEEINKIVGLAVGGDDYITKPFLPGELIARIKSNIRRSKDYAAAEKRETHVLHVGDLKINLFSRQVYCNDEPIPLLPKEFNILLMLAKTPNRIFSKEEIFEHVWNDQSFESDSNTVMVHISNLRKKIGQGQAGFPRIVTVKGIGYKLILRGV